MSRSVLVTGASKGIGRAIAETLSDEGCNIAICARNADDVAAAVESISAKGVKATGKGLDVADSRRDPVSRNHFSGWT